MDYMGSSEAVVKDNSVSRFGSVPVSRVGIGGLHWNSLVAGRGRGVIKLSLFWSLSLLGFRVAWLGGGVSASSLGGFRSF